VAGIVCTLVVSLAPDRPCPVALAAVRDEFLDRPWDPPGRHWADRPTVVGGRDALAGGTWLAFDPAARRVACVLNGEGRMVAANGRRSRGELPLLAATAAAVPDDLTPYDPFHLVTVDPTGVRVLTWNGYTAHRYGLGAGTHLFVNHGRWAGPGDRRTPRATHLGPVFAAARPEPVPDAPVARAWAPWLGLLDGAERSPGDPQALLIRSVAAGRPWGTSSVTLLGFGVDGPARYDFLTGPSGRHWQRVRT
jgi:hypothetical protein